MAVLPALLLSCALLLVSALLFKALFRLARYQELSGIVLVTGATGAVGQELVSQLQQKPGVVAVVAVGRNANTLTAQQQTSAGRVLPLIYDLERFEAAEFAQKLQELLDVNGFKGKAVDHVFLNAGSGYFGQFQQQTDLARYLTANVTSALEIARLVLAGRGNEAGALKEAKQQSKPAADQAAQTGAESQREQPLQSQRLTVTFTGSCTAYTPQPRYCAYHVAKAALAAAVAGLRAEGVSASIVAPATVLQSGFFEQSAMKGYQQGMRKLGTLSFFAVRPQAVARALIKAAEFDIAESTVGWVAWAARCWAGVLGLTGAFW